MTRRLILSVGLIVGVVANEHMALAATSGPAGIEAVANEAALEADRTSSASVLREGFREPGDGGRATYHHVAGRCARPDGATQVAAADGGCWLIDEATTITPALFGARCRDKGFDDTAAIQAAFATGRHVQFSGLGTQCTVTRALVLDTPGQLIAGEDRERTRLLIGPGFSGAGVLVFRSGEPGPIVRDLAISFEQPADDASTSLAAMRTYPPAILARTTPRFELDHLGCYAATTCVDMTGNSGGATISDLQMSAFRTGIEIDGSLDTVRLLEVHAWPFHVTPRQSTLMLDNVTWVKVAKVDDFKVVGGLFLGGKTGFEFSASRGGTATGSLTNVDFDGEHHGIVMSAGNISVHGGYFAGGATGSQDVAMTGGTLGIYGATIGCSNTPAAANIATISVNGVQAILSVVGSPSMICAGMLSPILAVSAGTVVFSDNMIIVEPHVAYSRPRVDITGASRITAIGNRMSDKGAGEGTFIAIERDNFNRVIGNVAPGWTNKLAGKPMPITALVANPGLYFGN